MRVVDRTRLAGVAFLGGLAAGMLVWSAQVQRSRRDLFNRSPIKRLAALGYLGSQFSFETARLLTEYVRWEKRPMLRQRGQHLLRRLEAHLDQARSSCP